MKQTILKKFRTKRNAKKEFFLDYKNAIGTEVIDEYYEDDNENLYEILCNSVTHARQEIIKLSNKDRDYLNVEKLCNDYRLFLTTIHEITEEYNFITINRNEDYYDFESIKEDFANLTEDIAKLNDDYVDTQIVECIKEYIMQLVEDNPNEKDIIYQRRVFEKIGDAVLGLDGDVRHALKWYSIMEIDRKVLDSKERYESLWYKKTCENIRFLLELSHDSIFHTIFIGYENGFDMSEACQDSLYYFFQAWGDYKGSLNDEAAERIWESAIRFAQIVAKDLDNKEIIDKKQRMETLTSLVLFDISGFYYLIMQSGKDYSNLKSKDKKIINEILESNHDNEYWIYLKEYWNTTKPGNKYRIKNILKLAHVIELNEKILAVLRMKNYKGKIAYYTSSNTLYKMLPGKADSQKNIGKFAVMHVAYMNDPSEGKVLMRYVFGDSFEKNNSGRLRATYPYVFIKCFTNKIDYLPMWEMYGEHAGGFCIVLDMLTINNKNKRLVPLYNVCYVYRTADGKYEIREEDNGEIKDDVVIIEEALNEILTLRGKNDEVYNNIFKQLISRITYLFKSADYSYECEKRILYTVSSGTNESICLTSEENNPKLYILSDIDLEIDEIILGPKFKNASGVLPDLQKRVDEMNSMLELNNRIDLTYSAIEYK